MDKFVLLYYERFVLHEAYETLNISEGEKTAEACETWSTICDASVAQDVLRER